MGYLKRELCAATPLPSRGGVPEGRGGVCNFVLGVYFGSVDVTDPTPAPPLEGRGVPTGFPLTGEGSVCVIPVNRGGECLRDFP